MKYLVRLALVLLFTALPAHGAGPDDSRSVEYHIRFPDLIHHEAEVSVQFAGLTVGESLEVRMSRTSPGRYALHEFAKNVYSVKAVDGKGIELEIEHVNPHQWNVTGHDGTVVFSYTLFADQADGTFSAIDLTHVHLNMPATFMWARGMEDVPIKISFDLPRDSWNIATQLFETGSDKTFAAPNLQYFLDSPAEISDFDLRTWVVESKSGATEVRLAVHHEGSREEMDAFTESMKKIVQTQYEIFGGPPDYDSDSYTFLVDFLEHASRDGMEHRNSTYVTSSNPLTADGRSNLWTMTHEFFHQWNVERIRPKALEPFSLEHENQTDELWFAEGVTSYYTGLSIRRAGLMTDAEFAHELSAPINAVVNLPGRNYYSAAEMSRQAPFMDRATAGDRMNTANTFISYYTWGNAIGLALDLSLRSKFGKSLDDFMRLMWDVHGVEEVPYTSNDLKNRLAELTGDKEFVTTFFERFIEGKEIADYDNLLKNAGFKLRPRRAGVNYIGGKFVEEDDRVVVSSSPVRGTPLFETGLDVGDVLISTDGVPATSVASFLARVRSHEPGEKMMLTFNHRGVVVRSMVEIRSDPTLEVVPFEAEGIELTPNQLEFRERWISGYSK